MKDQKQPNPIKRLFLRITLDKSGRTPATYQKNDEKIQFHWFEYEKDFLTKKLEYRYKQTLIPVQMLVNASQNIKRTLLEDEGIARYNDVFGEHYLSITESVSPGKVFVYHKTTTEDGNWKDTGFQINRRVLNRIIKNH